MKVIFAALALATICAAPAFAQPAPTPMRPNALQEFPPKNGARLTVTSPAFPEGGDIPSEHLHDPLEVGQAGALLP